jgi:hypothetical protein
VLVVWPVLLKNATLESNVKRYNMAFAVLGAVSLLTFSVLFAHSQTEAASPAGQAHMVITDMSLGDSSEIPTLSPQNVQVKQGKNVLNVQHLIPARGDNAALQLVVMIDDTCDAAGIGNNLNELREFINAQPPTTAVAVAYMSNASVQFAQNFTTDHAQAAKALRLPRGNLSSMDSPYLSLISLVKGWPQQKVRREVLMITDGIDRLRGERPTLQAPPSRTPAGARPGATTMPTMPGPTTMPTISVDADSASTMSQQYGVIVHSIYATGVGRAGRNAWEAQLGQSGIAKIADESGGEYYSLGVQNPVSFKPYLDRLQKIFDNQYFLVFQAAPGKKSSLQRVSISTNVPNTEIASANNVWVPAAS